MNEPISIDYTFRFSDGRQMEFHVRLDNITLDLLRPDESESPEWTRLGYCKCANCPLDQGRNPFCPLALSLAGLVHAFGGSVSYEQVDVVVETGARRYSKHVPLQTGLSSLVGIYMAAGGCPVLAWLKPMARFHLPFASEEETKYRALSMYLLAQYFRCRSNLRPDWEMTELMSLYENVRIVNRGFHKRLSGVGLKDANVNAIIILDCFADAVSFSLDRGMMEDMERIFRHYLE